MPPPPSPTDLLHLNGPGARHKVGALHGHLNGSCNPLPLGESVLGSTLRGGLCVLSSCPPPNFPNTLILTLTSLLHAPSPHLNLCLDCSCPNSH